MELRFNYSQLDELKGEILKGKIGDMEHSRLIMGGNLIGGWAHARDLIYASQLVKSYHDDRRVVGTMELAEKCGINAIITNAYTTSATSTPSRFSLLTGMYAWRQPGTGVASGDAPALIRPGKETWPLVMQRAGYRTAVIGKWHLGLGGDEGPDWNGGIETGPLETGFYYCWLTRNKLPCADSLRRKPSCAGS